MKKIITLIGAILITSTVFSQSSGYRGKKIFFDISAHFDPTLILEINAPFFSALHSGKLGYSLSDRVSVAINYSGGNLHTRKTEVAISGVKNTYKIQKYGIDVYFTRRGFVSPIGKSWLLGIGQLKYEGYDEINDIDHTKIIEKSAKTVRLGHESRIPFKDSNIYFMTQFTTTFKIFNGKYSKPYIPFLQGKIGVGIIL